MINDSENWFDSQYIWWYDKPLQHVYLSPLNLIISILLVPYSKKEVYSNKKYLFSSNQLSTLVFVSRGSPKFAGREDVTQNFCESVHNRLFWSFLCLRSEYSYRIPNCLIGFLSEPLDYYTLLIPTLSMYLIIYLMWV
jgi:hypothetical protein